MKFLAFILFFLLTGFLFISQAHAIIFLPAIILIPIAKIIAVIIGMISLPSFSFGFISSKTLKKSPRKILLIIISLLVIGAFILAILLKIQNPDRPFI